MLTLVRTRFWRTGAWLLALLVVAVAARHLAFVWLDNAGPTGDGFAHMELSLDVYTLLVRAEWPWLWFRLLFDQGPDYYPPLLYLVTSAWYAFAGVGIAQALESTVVFTIILTVSAWALGRRLWGRRGALLSAFLAASTPAVANFGTTYYQDIPLAAMILANLAVLDRTRSFRRPGWSLAAGVVAGFGMLTKPSFWMYAAPAWALYAFWPLWRRLAVRFRVALAGLSVVSLAVLAAQARLLLEGDFRFETMLLIQGGAVLWGLGFFAAARWCLARSGIRPSLARAESRRLGFFLMAAAAGFFVCSSWYIHGAQHMMAVLRQVAQDDLRRISSENSWGHYYGRGWCTHAGAYLALLSHVSVLPTVFLAALAQLWLLRRKLCRPRLAPFYACLAFSAVALCFNAFYHSRYSYPLAAMIGVSAGFWGGRRRAWVAAVLVVSGTIQLLGGLPAVREGPGAAGLVETSGIVDFGDGGLGIDELSTSWNWLLLRHPDTRPTEIRRLFHDLREGAGDLALVVPCHSWGTFNLNIRLHGLESRVWTLIYVNPADLGPGGSFTRRGDPPSPLGSGVRWLLVNADVLRDGELSARLRGWGLAEDAEFVRSYQVPHTGSHGTEFLLFRVRPAGASAGGAGT